MDLTKLTREIWECYIAGDFMAALAKTQALFRALSLHPDDVLTALTEIVRERYGNSDFHWGLRLLGSDCFREWGHERDPKMLFGLINEYSWYNQTADKLNVELLCELMRGGGAEYTLKVILWSRARETRMSEWALDQSLTFADPATEQKEGARLRAAGLAFIDGKRPTAQVQVWNYLAFLHRAFLRCVSPQTFANTWRDYGDSWHRAASEFNAHPELATKDTTLKATVEYVFDAYACIADVSQSDVMSPFSAWRRIAGYLGGGNYLVPTSLIQALATNAGGYDPLGKWAKKLLGEGHKVENGFIRCWTWNTRLS